MNWFQKLLDERFIVLEEDFNFVVRRGASPTEARAWFELQAKEIAAMASFWDDDDRTVAKLDEFRRRLMEGDPSKSAPSELDESLPSERSPFE